VRLLARRGSPLVERAGAAGLEVSALAFESRFRPLSDLRDARAVAGMVRAAPGGALIHCHRGKDHWCAQTARSLCGANAPLMRSRHVVVPVKGHLANRWLFRRATRVICVSEATRRGYESTGRLPVDGVRVIPSGSGDLERFRPPAPAERQRLRAGLGLGEAQRAAVLVGRFQRIKGQAVFLEAAARLAPERENVVFLLVGDGRSRAGLEARAAESGLGERFRLLGRREDVPEVLAACDLGVVASLGSEGFSRAAVEYMAAGLPVVATRVGALPEIVVEGETGLLVDPDDAPGLAGAMGRVLGDPELAARMGAAGRRRVEEHFSRERWLEAHERLYLECRAPAAE
jgi:glycosyltransferase involved in cell wall biosynthesis